MLLLLSIILYRISQEMAHILKSLSQFRILWSYIAVLLSLLPQEYRCLLCYCRSSGLKYGISIKPSVMILITSLLKIYCLVPKLLVWNPVWFSFETFQNVMEIPNIVLKIIVHSVL